MTVWKDCEEYTWVTLPLSKLEEVVQKVLVKDGKDLKRFFLAIRRLTIVAGKAPTPRLLFLLARLLAISREYEGLQRCSEELTRRFPDTPEEAFVRGFLLESLAARAEKKEEQERLTYLAYAAYRDAGKRAPNEPYSTEAFAAFMRRGQRRTLGPANPKPAGVKTSWEEVEAYRRRHAI